MKVGTKTKCTESGKQLYRSLSLQSHGASRQFVVNGRTYGEVYQLAGGIQRLCKNSGDENSIVCLCTEDKALIAAALIASAAGGPRLVLPFSFSRPAVEEILDNIPVRFILADRMGDFPSSPEVMTALTLPESPLSLNSWRDPDEPFLKLFTGGSTGKPKMWDKTPRNMLAEALHLSCKFGISSEDIFLATVSPLHIYGLLFSVLLPLVASACVLAPVFNFPREIMTAAKEYRASILIGIPAHYRVLRAEDLQRYDLRMAFSSAGTLDKEDSLYFSAKTGLEITEIFGSTETGGLATRRRSQDGDSWRPLAPVDCRADKGMLRVRSAFIHSGLPRDTEGFFVTSDRVDFKDNNRFILMGRADDIVKVAGKRVDLAAVQIKIKQIPNVMDAVVISLPTRKGRQNELAALVATHLTLPELRRRIAAVSETYAAPKRIVIVNEIPLTSSGKYDRTKIEGMLALAPDRKNSPVIAALPFDRSGDAD